MRLFRILLAGIDGSLPQLTWSGFAKKSKTSGGYYAVSHQHPGSRSSSVASDCGWNEAYDVSVHQHQSLDSLSVVANSLHDSITHYVYYLPVSLLLWHARPPLVVANRGTPAAINFAASIDQTHYRLETPLITTNWCGGLEKELVRTIHEFMVRSASNSSLCVSLSLSLFLSPLSLSLAPCQLIFARFLNTFPSNESVRRLRRNAISPMRCGQKRSVSSF